MICMCMSLKNPLDRKFIVRNEINDAVRGVLTHSTGLVIVIQHGVDNGGAESICIPNHV